MKEKYHLILRFSVVFGCLLILNACNLPNSASTQPPVSTEATPSQVVIASPQIQHQAMPGELPGEDSLTFGDQDTSPYATQKIAPDGDRFLKDLFERPFNANTMDTYFSFLDIQRVSIYEDDVWFYGVLVINGTDSAGGFPATYGLELDLDLNGRGDWLILASSPVTGSWSVAGVKVWQDSNRDVGNNLILASDPPQQGDGFDYLVFDQGNGNDPDAAWSRVVAANLIQIAFKKSLLAGDLSFLVSAWAGEENLNPAWFDLNDHFTHDEAGAADPGYPLFYPIKVLDKIDNTCRMPVGFGSNGKEPGLCPTYIPKQPGATPVPVPPPVVPPPGPF